MYIFETLFLLMCFLTNDRQQYILTWYKERCAIRTRLCLVVGTPWDYYGVMKKQVGFNGSIMGISE